MDFIDLKTQYRTLRADIDARVQRVLDHGQYILGPEVKELEAKLAAFTGSDHCVAVSSGTDALLIALMAAGIGPGDEVITTPFTFVASVEVIVLAGATPVLVDIEADTANIDVARIAAAITPRTRAIMPVSLYGQPADMDAINELAGQRGIMVIEDAAQSFGAIYRGRRSCHLSTVGCTSFFPSKPLGCYGDGGAIFTDDAAMAESCREIRVHGQSGRYHHTRIGVGGRIDTIQCAVLLAKLERFQWELDQRSRLAQRYAARIKQTAPRAELLSLRDDRTSAWAQYTILVSDRDRVQARMQERGVPTAVHYPKGMHQQPAYARYFGGAGFPVCETLSQRVLSLPFSADLNEEDLTRVVDELARATA